MTDIPAKIKKLAKQTTFPDGQAYTGISVANIFNISDKTGCPQREVELCALGENIIPERYVRNMRTYTPEEQALLLKSTVSIIGLGGLGGAVTEILARGGIGTLNIVDGDCFEDSNLNRQFFSSEELLETPKAEAAVKRIKAINSSIDVNQFTTFFNEENASEILKNADVVVDCLDNLSMRFTLEEIAKNRGIPFVSAAVAGSAGHITTIFPEDPGLELIYGNRENAPHKGAETSLGCLPQAVTTIAAIECSEVTKILLKNGSVLKNQLLVVDLMDNMIEVYKLL